jgi:hypothetical protein
MCRLKFLSVLARCLALALGALLAQPILGALGSDPAAAQPQLEKQRRIDVDQSKAGRVVIPCFDAPKPNCGGPAPSCSKSSVCRVANGRPVRVCKQWKCDIKLN